MTLDELALLHGTDKSSASHNYTPLYERYLPHHSKGSLLELGWGGHENPVVGGASARMWADYYPSWRVTVIDNEHKLNNNTAGVMLAIGDQADKGFTDQVATLTGPYDVIIDDASHLSSLTIASFKNLWPHLKPGGIYVVEDTHSSYHDFYYGARNANANPDSATKTAMHFLKRLADEANFHDTEWDWDLFPRQHWLGYEVEAVHFHFNIAFVEKRTAP